MDFSNDSTLSASRYVNKNLAKLRNFQLIPLLPVGCKRVFNVAVSGRNQIPFTLAPEECPVFVGSSSWQDSR